jgi:hypothetical protein
MRKKLGLFFISLVFTMALLWAGVIATPGYLVNKRNQEYLIQADGYNNFYHQGLPDDKFKAFVSPSPDLLYSYLVFNTEKSALAVEIPPFHDYWVNQMVDDNTDSFAYVSYKTGSNDPIKYILYSDDTPPFDPPEGYQPIKSPSTIGTFLLRYLVRTPKEIPQIDSIRRSIRVYAFSNETNK